MSEEKTAPQNDVPTVDNSAPGKNGATRTTVRIRAKTESGWFEIRPELMQALQEEYSTVDVRRQVAKMILWAESNEASRWKKPMQGIHNWLKEEAKRETKRNGARAPRGTRAARAAKDVQAWFSTGAGWIEQGAAIGVLQEEGESFVRYRARVCIAMGPGPWINDRDWALMRAIEELRGESRATPADQARAHIERLREMGLYRSSSVH